VSEYPALTSRTDGAVPTRVTATLSGGKRITREVDHAPGFAARPMNRSDVERKFRGNVGERWPKEQTDANLEGALCDGSDQRSCRATRQLRCSIGRDTTDRDCLLDCVEKTAPLATRLVFRRSPRCRCCRLPAITRGAKRLVTYLYFGLPNRRSSSGPQCEKCLCHPASRAGAARSKRVDRA
jgi:hypothetical protein